MKFETIVDKYSKLAYKIAIDMISSPEDAQDIVQESYLSLYSHFKEYKKLQENEIKNILCKIVLNKCKDFLKSSKRKENINLEDISNFQEYSLKEDFIENIIKTEDNNYIKEIIKSLKKPYAEILTLYYINEYTLDEIADKMKTTRGTIKVQITRGKQKLKEILRKERNFMKKIDKIDKLLNDDMELEKYLESLETKNIKIPDNLNECINIKVQNKKNKYLVGICKIAACLIFSLAICRTDFIQNDQFNKKEKIDTKDNIVVEQKISEFCKIFTTPINLGGNK